MRQREEGRAGNPAVTTLLHEGFQRRFRSRKNRGHSLCADRAKRRDEWPCPAPVDHRHREKTAIRAKSRTVSKYFSICSARPVKTQTVPLRPAGGAQRAKRNFRAVGRFESCRRRRLQETGLGGDRDERHGSGPA